MYVPVHIDISTGNKPPLAEATSPQELRRLDERITSLIAVPRRHHRQVTTLMQQSSTVDVDVVYEATVHGCPDIDVMVVSAVKVVGRRLLNLHVADVDGEA